MVLDMSRDELEIRLIQVQSRFATATTPQDLTRATEAQIRAHLAVVDAAHHLESRCATTEWHGSCDPEAMVLRARLDVARQQLRLAEQKLATAETG